jgi:toxin YoeB
MNLVFSANGWADYVFWQFNDRKLLQKINALIDDACRSPFSGLGKPEPLRGDLSGHWSRRISGEHRLVYRVAGSGPDQSLIILQCRLHY